MSQSTITIEHISPGNMTSTRIYTFFQNIEYRYEFDKNLNESYCQKLSDHADLFFALVEGKDVGLAAVYTNDDIHKNAYITFLGVLKKYQGPVGVTKMLVHAFETYAKSQGILKINAEFHQNNKAMVYWCKRFNYTYNINADITDSYQKIEKVL